MKYTKPMTTIGSAPMIMAEAFASDDSAHPPWCTCCTCNPDDAVDRAVELAVRPPRLTSAPLPLAEVLASLPLTERPVS